MAGAALATVMAQAVSVVLSILIIRKRKPPFAMKKEYIRFNPEIKRFIRVGTPIAFQEILTQLSFPALCAFINRLGLDASSGYGVANKIVSFVMLMPDALMQSMASFVAQNVGAGQEKRAEKSNGHRYADRMRNRYFYRGVLLYARGSACRPFLQ